MVAPARHSARWRLVAAWAVWLLAAVACCGLGYRYVHRRADAVTPAVDGRAATTDTWLAWLGAPHPTAALQRAAAGVPADRSIVVVGPADESGLQLAYFIISSLAWPRQVSLVTCTPDSPAPTVVVAATQPVGGLLYFRLEGRGVSMRDATTVTPIVRMEHSGAGAGLWCSL